jgi:hypothetical protein
MKALALFQFSMTWRPSWISRRNRMVEIIESLYFIEIF